MAVALIIRICRKDFMSPIKNLTLCVCTLALLVGCASTSMGAQEETTTRAKDEAPYSFSARLYGDYLAASYANQLGDAKARSQYFSRAFALEPENLALGRTSLEFALTAGDNALARTLAIEVHALDEYDGLATAVLGAHELAKGRFQESLEYFGSANDGIGLEDVNSLMRGWAQVGLGNHEAALETFTQLDGGKYFELIGSLQKAKLYARMGDVENADKFFAEVDEIGVSAIESLLSQVRSLVKRDEKEKALRLLNAFADKNGGVFTGPVRALIDALEADQEIEVELSPAALASRALTEPAFGYYGAQEQYQAAEMLLQLALELDPDNDKAKLFLGSVLEDVGRKEDARQAYGLIDDMSPYTVSARLSEANLYFDDDDSEAALQVLEKIYKSHPSKITQSALGRAYLIIEDYASALPYYEALIADMTEAELIDNPSPRYIRGICLERLDRWQDAVVDFEFVLKHQPENSDVLNYLGYTWVDKGVNLTKAFEMIRKAVALEPKSGAITDSLGWAHYKLGQYSEARIKLEDAVEYSPTSATIVDHLGDVYWKLGRIREAGYQWQRALTLDPTDKEVRVLKAKLKGGLGAASGVE